MRVVNVDEIEKHHKTDVI